jgi:hypothetical protein
LLRPESKDEPAPEAEGDAAAQQGNASGKTP